MAQVAVCPQCAAQLVLTGEVPPGADASCPICDARFDVTRVTVRKLPEALFVARRADPLPTPADPGDLASRETLEMIDPGKTVELPARPTVPGRGEATPRGALSSWQSRLEPHGGAEAGDPAESGATLSGASLESLLSAFRTPVGPPAPTHLDADQPEPTEAGYDDGYGVEAPDHPLGARLDAEVGDPSDPDGDAGLRPVGAGPLAREFHFDLHRPADESTRFEPGLLEGDGPSRTRLVRRRRSRSVLGQLIGVVAGGALGLSAGYLALLWIGGPARDALGIAKHLPAYLLPASFAGRGASQSSLVVADLAPAGGQSSAEPAATPTPLVDPAVEAAAFESPSDTGLPAAEAPEPSPPLGSLMGAPTYGPDDISALLAQADSARAVMATKSLSEPAAAAELGSAYAKLCQLAQTLTFLEPGEIGSATDMRSMEAQDVFRRLFFSAHARTDASQIAARWMGWTKRPHGGVFFVGTPGAPRFTGSLYETPVTLAGGGPVTVLSPRPLAPDVPRTSDSFAVVGCVVEEPAKRVRGYTGDAPRAVWVGYVLPLGEPKQE